MRASEFITEDVDGKLAWRIRFSRFKDLPSILPERENKIYLMPMDKSAFRTFRSLTGKDNRKINNMPTEVYKVSGNAMVGDMIIINYLFNAIGDLKRNRKVLTPDTIARDEEDIEKLKKEYLDTRVPYSQYHAGMFKYPEILAEPEQLTKLDKAVSYDKNTGEITIKDKK